MPSKSINPIFLSIKYKTFEKDLHIVLKVDSKWENRLVIQQKVKSSWKLIEKIKNLPKDEVFKYSVCLNKFICYRLKLIDKKEDGIDGWYDVFWKGMFVISYLFFRSFVAK